MKNIRRLGSGQIKPVWDVNLLNFFKSSFLGKIYFHYFKRYPLIRASVHYAWIKLTKIYLWIVSSYYPLINLSDYTQKIDKSAIQTLIPKKAVKTQKPVFYPLEKAKKFELNQGYTFPEIFFTNIENCTVIGASNFIYLNDEVVSHNLFRSSHDFTSEELHGRFNINSKKSLISRRSKFVPDFHLEQAAAFTDAVSGNYAHFLTEVLPRVFMYAKEFPNLEASLIIDYGLHPNLLEALELIVNEKVDVVALESGESVFVKSLYAVSCCGYVPFQRRPNTGDFLDHSDGIFSPDALCGMCDFIKSKVIRVAKPLRHKKIFIKRNSKYRNLINASEIESLLVNEGFVVIETEKLSFVEQVEIFSNAEVIVGATGAAFANIIFCNSEAKIIILIVDYKDMIYGYWQNMANAVGNEVTYVLGESIDAISQFHSDFHINIEDLLAAITALQTDSNITIKL